MSGSLSNSKSYSNNYSKQSVWDKQTPFLTDMYSQAQSLFNNPNQNLTQGNQMALNYAGSNGLQNTIGNTQNALNFALNPQNSFNNPYLQGAMQSAIRPLTQNFQENVLSGITDGAVAAGQSGSSRQGIAEGIAARGYMDQVGDVVNNMAYQNYNDGFNRMSNAVGQAGQVANLGMLPSSIYQNVGNSDWDQLARYQAAIGAPTTLGQSSGGSKSTSWATSGGIGG